MFACQFSVSQKFSCIPVMPLRLRHKSARMHNLIFLHIDRTAVPSVHVCLSSIRLSDLESTAAEVTCQATCIATMGYCHLALLLLGTPLLLFRQFDSCHVYSLVELHSSLSLHQSINGTKTHSQQNTACFQHQSTKASIPLLRTGIQFRTHFVVIRSKCPGTELPRFPELQVLHVEVNIEGSGMQYQPGDSIGLLPHNDAQLVEEVLQHLGQDGDRVFSIASSSGDGSKLLQHLGWPCSLRQALTVGCDITSIPRSPAALCTHPPTPPPPPPSPLA